MTNNANQGLTMQVNMNKAAADLPQTYTLNPF